MTVAFFDFDGTITTRDSFLHFIAFCKGKRALYLALIRYGFFMLGYKLDLVTGKKAKELLLAFFFKEMEIRHFNDLCQNYTKDRLPKIIRTKALEKIRWHQKQGHQVFIVSASVENWIAPWSAINGVKVVASKLEVIAGKVTGKLAGENCIGAEKVKRIKESLETKSIVYSYAYGDSKGDKEMLSFVDKGYLNEFN